jgi:hypothetical protein
LLEIHRALASGRTGTGRRPLSAGANSYTVVRSRRLFCRAVRYSIHPTLARLGAIRLARANPAQRVPCCYRSWSRCTQKIRRDLARLCRLDHVHRRRVAAFPARSAFQRRLKFPDRRIARSADGIEGQAGPRLAAMAFEPAVSANGVEHCLGSVASTIRLCCPMAAH